MAFGSHELGQNFLVDRRFTTVMADILRHAPPLPVVELASGRGALTRALLAIGLPVTAVEVDPRHVAVLRMLPVSVVHADALTYRFDGPHHIAGNIPFGITTPLLRIVLASDVNTAALLVQWEVARKRAAVGGTTQLTASWWPWFEFELAGRVPRTAFQPVPNVDGGILVIRRRERRRVRRR